MSLNTPSLTAVVHAIVLAPPSGIDARTIASLLGRNYQTMMSELTRQPGHKLGADMVLPIMAFAGSDEPAHFLARQRGGVFVKLPDVQAGDDPVQLECMRAVKEFGELMAELGASLGDGKLSREECERIDREGQEAVTAIMGLLKRVGEIRRGQS